SGTEQISGLFHIEVDLLAELANASSVTPDAIVGSLVTVKVGLGEDLSSHRYINGMVRRFYEGGRDERFVHYHAEVVPWFWLLTQTSDCKIFQDATVIDVIKEVFDEHKGSFSFIKYSDKTTGTYTKQDYCVQYRETDFNFVSRLMEEEGIHYFFDHSESGHTLVLADSTDANPACTHQDAFYYLPEGGEESLQDSDTIRSWQRSKQIRPGKYTLRDFHFQMPSKDLEVSMDTKYQIGGNSGLEVYDYFGEYAQRFNQPDKRLGDVEKEGGSIVGFRMNQQEAPYDEVKGAGNGRSMAPGNTFSMQKHFATKDEKFLITSVRHSCVQSPDYVSNESIVGSPYENQFTAIPHAIAYRPPRRTPKPVVQGLQSAIVVGPSGEEIYTDKYGRIRVQFHWDRLGKKNDSSTCWVRVSQIWAGKQWGVHFWPRIGHEVLVSFFEGDPDQPIVTGCVYNAENMPPYDMPDNQTRSGIKSRSSKEGSSSNFNEVRFEDKKDEEEIYIHAEKDMNRVVENNDTLKVGFEDQKDGDQTIEIHNNQDVTIGNNKAKDGSQTLTVFNNQDVKIGDAQAKDGSQTETIWKDRTTTIKTGNDTLTVQTGNRKVSIDKGNDTLEIKMGNRETKISMGNRTTKVSLGKDATEAMQSIELKVGASSVKVDQTGVTIKGMMIKIEGTAMTEVKGAMTKVEGSGMLQARGGIAMIN
ncbi:MAG: type VI secretion system tip protein TssI/VgrG, partial [Planctomycetota bacterium]|nr:type VI secretion system tip protein TssI/VgrG [Planctomycetota bacterium]